MRRVRWRIVVAQQVGAGEPCFARSHWCLQSRRLLPILLASGPRVSSRGVDGGRVVGGWPAQTRHWPGFVALRMRNQQRISAYFCGGVAISERWVLTAAHCVYGAFDGRDEAGHYFSRPGFGTLADPLVPGVGYFEVVAGHGRLENANADAGHRISSIFLHPGYLKPGLHSDASTGCSGNCPTYSGADIALLKVAEDQRPLPAVARIALDPEYDPPSTFPTRAMVAGFGRTDPRNNDFRPFPSRTHLPHYWASSDILQETTIPYATDKACRAANKRPITSRWPEYALGDGQICAGDEALGGKSISGRDSCSGDSGGPIVAYDKNWCPFVVGLTSWGANKCGQEDTLGVYTRISAFSDWIKTYVPDAGGRDSGLAEITNREDAQAGLECCRTDGTGPESGSLENRHFLRRQTPGFLGRAIRSSRVRASSFACVGP